MSKAIKVISNGPALPLFILWYGVLGKPSPISFISYLLFSILFHEFTLKSLFHRRRPDTATGQLGLSFPSSHSFTSGIVLTIALFFNFPYKYLVAFLSGIVAINRTAIGVHYLADVIAGMFFGIVVGFGWFAILGIAGVSLP